MLFYEVTDALGLGIFFGDMLRPLNTNLGDF